ncbi:hypothetical protein KX729_29300 [Rhizobium sp. XQZ8]|uniref:hypothetical protein n=1 Tax=Rhizobium populisoli TaxID=2859785 RepID=UPI001CA4D2F1|nr:hypothetical protein [Rhizobium populisoli]MBW6425514.1 hypothetical protein [Rhizobium populisoli]
MSISVVAIICVVVGTAIASLTASLYLNSRKKQRMESAERARDLAFRIVLALDDMVGACYAAANDFPEINVDDPTDFVFHSADPTVNLPADANWSLLTRELADEIRWLPNRLRNMVDGLYSIEIDPPDYNDLFERRQEGYARLGLRAMDQIEKICETYDVPLPDRPEFYNPRNNFESKLQQMDNLWKRRAESASHVPAGRTNVSPLFGSDATRQL